jgi:cytochrome P450
VTSPPLSYDPSSHALQADPFATYRWMQDEAPLYRSAELDFWALTRYDDVLAGLLDPGLLSSASGTLIEHIQNDQPPGEMIIFMDPPEHDVLRALVRRAFTPRRVSGMEHEIRELCAAWLEPIREAGGGDVCSGLATKLSTTVISKLIGVPDSDHELIRSASDRLLARDDGSIVAPDTAIEAGAELFVYFSELVAARRARPVDDMTTALTTAEVEDGDGGSRLLTDMEIVFFSILLVVAGNETTAKMIATGAVVLDEHRGEREQLIADPSLWVAAVEELLRYDPPSHYQGRVTTRPCQWYGEQVPKGSTVLLVNGAANRDPRTFEEADRFRLGRANDRHLAFGRGVHFCLGASLARLETRVALEELVTRFPDYVIDTDGVTRAFSSNVRGLSRVPFQIKGS